MKIVVVYNSKSGNRLNSQILKEKCKNAGLTVEKFIAINSHTKSALSSYIKKNVTILVVGGDGSISGIAGMIAGTRATLAPLPGGTLNHLVSDLGIPQDIDEALERLTTAKPRKIDVGTVNGKVFINNSSLGVYPLSLRIRKEHQSKLGKWPIAVFAAFRAVVRLKTYRVTIDNQTFRSPFLFVGNNRYTIEDMGGIKRTRLDEGVMTVFIARTQSRMELIKIAALAFIGKVHSSPAFDIYYPQELVIETLQPRINIAHDGEVTKLSSPIHYKLQKRQLNIL